MQRVKKKVGFIIPYFGSFKWYVKFFLHTCKYNLDFDFIFITDLDFATKDLGKNIIVIKKSFEEVRQLVAKKLKVPVYVFLKESLIRKFGQKFYDALDATAKHLNSKP